MGREYTRARRLVADNKKEEARRIFGNLRRLDPTNLGALYNEALLTEDPAARLSLKEEIEALVESAPSPSLRAGYLAVLSLVLPEAEKRDQVLKQALELDADHPLAHALMAMLLEERGEFDKAHEHNLRAAAGERPPPRVFRKLAAFQAAGGMRQEAIENYERYLLFEPDDVIALYNLGTLYLEEEQWDKAEQYLGAAYSLDRQDLDIILNYAKAAIENGRYQAAMTLLEQAQRLDPREPVIYYNMGVFQTERLGEQMAAIRSFKRYLELGGDEVRRVRGWIQELEERLSK